MVENTTVEGLAKDPDRTKAMIAITVSAFTSGLAVGAVMPLISMSMELRGESADNIGYVVAAAPLALMMTGPFINPMVRVFGLLGSMVLGTMLVVATMIALPFWYGIPEWIVLRFVAGIGIAAVWILSETWVNALATNQNRGRLISLFMFVMTLGFGLGPVLVSIIGPSEIRTFFIAAAIIAASLIPLVLARNVAPDLGIPQKWSFVQAFRVAPLVMATALLAGVTDSAQISFIPVYGVRMGQGESTALYMLIAIISGTVLSQVPLYFFSDRIDRNKLLVICLVACFALGGVVPFVLDQPILLWPVLVLWGGTAFALYSIAIILLGDRFAPAELAGANAAFVCVFEMGSIIGPISVGHAMEQMGPNGMPAVLVLSCLPLLVLALWRRVLSPRITRHRAAEKQKNDIGKG